MANIRSSISFGLVNIPVTLNPIIKNNDTSFNQLHNKCKKRISYIKYCPHCKVDVKEKDIIKGYEFEKNKYITFKKEELDKLKLNFDKEIDIVSFIKINEIDPTYFEKSYVILSDGKSKAYDLFCEAIKKTNLVALAKTVISSKFYYCILRFLTNKIIMTTLYFEEEINIKENENKSKINQKELDLAIKIINSLKGKFEPEKYKDEYQDKIKQAIEDKKEGKKIKKSSKKTNQKINDLMKALEKSLKEK